MSEEQPNALRSAVKDHEQTEIVGLSNIVPKSNGPGSAHSSMSAENSWNVKHGERVTQFFTKKIHPAGFNTLVSLCFRRGLRSDDQKNRRFDSVSRLVHFSSTFARILKCP